MNRGNRLFSMTALADGRELTWSKAYSIRFRCLMERERDDSDDEDVAYDLGRPFGAHMCVMAGPVVNNKRHVTLTMKLVPVGHMHNISKKYANMFIEDNSNIVVDRGVTSTFQTNEISVPCCDNSGCDRTSLLFPSLTIFVEWRPECESINFVLEPPNPIGAIYISDLNDGDHFIDQSKVKRANAVVPNYFPGPPAKTTPRVDDDTRKERIRKRKKELAEIRAKEASNKQPCPNGTVDDDDSELAEVLQRSREETGGAAPASSPRPIPPARAWTVTSPSYTPYSPSYAPVSPGDSPQPSSSDE